MTWLKNRLPKVDALAMSQPRKRTFHFVFGASSERDTAKILPIICIRHVCGWNLSSDYGFASWLSPALRSWAVAGEGGMKCFSPAWEVLDQENRV